jgi:RNA recognition motif-containing protein
MNKVFKNNSIAVLNIKYKVKKRSLRTIFSRFGEIVKISTIASKNNTLTCFIKYKDHSSVVDALTYKEIICCGIPLRIRKAFDQSDNERNSQNKCKCIICNRGLRSDLIKFQSCLYDTIEQLHEAQHQVGQTEEVKHARKELKETSKRIQRKIKDAIKQNF